MTRNILRPHIKPTARSRLPYLVLKILAPFFYNVSKILEVTVYLKFKHLIEASPGAGYDDDEVTSDFGATYSNNHEHKSSSSSAAAAGTNKDLTETILHKYIQNKFCLSFLHDQIMPRSMLARDQDTGSENNTSNYSQNCNNLWNRYLIIKDIGLLMTSQTYLKRNDTDSSSRRNLNKNRDRATRLNTVDIGFLSGRGDLLKSPALWLSHLCIRHGLTWSQVPSELIEQEQAKDLCELCQDQPASLICMFSFPSKTLL